MPRLRVQTRVCVSLSVHGMARCALSPTMLMMKTLGERRPPALEVSLGTARGNAAAPLNATTPASTELKAVSRRIALESTLRRRAELREEDWVFD